MKHILITILVVLLVGCASHSTQATSASGQQKHLTMPIKNRLLIPSNDGQQGVATDGELEGRRLEPVVHANHFWFAWAVFQPDTEIRNSVDEVAGPISAAAD